MSISTIIRSRPVYLLLLSLFFVFHGFTENYPYIPAGDCLQLFAVYAGSMLVCWFLLKWLFRSWQKAAFVTFGLFLLYFFFGYIYDNLNSVWPARFISKYSTILLLYILVFTIATIVVFRKKRLLWVVYRLNVFFLCLLLVDAAWLVSRFFGKSNYTKKDMIASMKVCDTCSKPDIYFILTDEYAGNGALAGSMQFSNDSFTNALQQRGFYTPNTVSNYNYTPFSIASMLNMKYLQGIEGSNTSHHDLNLCYSEIKENTVWHFLEAQGYALRNCSIFDISGQPAVVKETVLPARTRFITAQTLFNRLENNILFNMANKVGTAAVKKRLMIAYNSNLKVLESTQAAIHEKGEGPRFIYTHLEMPHYPYYFDRNGKRRQLTQMEVSEVRNVENYVEYLQYTNTVLLGLIDSIRVAASTPPIIILASDHGFREYPGKIDKKYYFINLVSVYLPNRKYENFYEGMSNVNLFRVLFNTQFAQQFPLLKDSTSFLRP